MEQKKDHNIVEIITFIAGLAVLLALVGFLIYQINKENGTPPKLEISSSYQPSMEHYSFKLQVSNKGDESAEDVNIKLSLYQEGKAVEDGNVTIQYVPVKSMETAWIVFHTDRKAGDSLVVSSVTYVKP